MNSYKKTIIDIIMPIISGLMVAAAFCSDRTAFFILFSIAPLQYSILQNFKLYKIFAYSMTVYFISFSWIFNSISKLTENNFIRIFIFILAITGISLMLSAFMLLPFCVFKITRLSKTKIALMFPFIYILGEWLQGIFYPVALPWLRLGNILSGYTLLIQPASLFGTLFISFLVLAVNMLIALFFTFIHFREKYIFIMTAVLIIASDILFGYQSLSSNSISQNNSYSAIIVQGNYHNKNKYNPMQIMEKYIDLSYSASGNKTDLILFPETSISSCIYENSDSKEKLCNLCADYSAALLFGSQYKKDTRRYNACIILTPEKEMNAAYFKRLLVPYGEYNPFKIKFLSFLSSEFSPGENSELIRISGENIGCVICFESVFSDSVRNLVKKGAEVITVLTNDSWLGYKIPLYQHHSHSIMRAVENGRYVLTSANTGVSSVIDNKGRIVAESQMNKEYIISERYYLNNKITLYTKFGDIIILPSCFMIFLAGTSFFIKTITRKENE